MDLKSNKLNSKKIFLYIEVFSVFLLIFINLAAANGEHWMRQGLIAHDNATFFVTATAYQNNLGSPYKDYWEYRPPGFLFLLDGLTRIFGLNIISFKIIETFFRFLIGIQIVFLLRKILPSFFALVIILISLFVFYSPSFGAWLYPEAYGIFFSMLGLLSFVYLPKTEIRFFLFGLFTSIAFQMKDIFGFGLLALVPPLFYFLAFKNYYSFFRAIIFAFLGLMIPLILLGIYLHQLGSLLSFFEVMNFKSNTYHAKIWNDPFLFLGRYYRALRYGKEMVTFFHPHSLTLFLMSCLIMFLIWLKKNITSKFLNIRSKNLIIVFPPLRVSINRNNLNYLIILFYSLGLYIGSTLIFIFGTPHYLFSTIIPTYILWSTLSFVLSKSLNSFLRIPNDKVIFLIITLLFLWPQKWITSTYQIIPVNLVAKAAENFSIQQADVPVEKYLNSKTNQSDCLLSVYGWGSAETYLYSKRRPCARFIIPNILLEDWQKIEYREAIINNPPKIIVYTLAGADLNTLRFEKEIINLPQILKECYIQDFTYTHNGRTPIKIYFPILNDKEQLKECMRLNSES